MSRKKQQDHIAGLLEYIDPAHSISESDLERSRARSLSIAASADESPDRNSLQIPPPLESLLPQGILHGMFGSNFGNFLKRNRFGKKGRFWSKRVNGLR